MAEVENKVNELCERRLELIKINTTEPWCMDDLENAIKYIGRDKARDALGMVNGLFKEEAAGTNFKLAILKLMYLIKNKSEFHGTMQYYIHI